MPKNTKEYWKKAKEWKLKESSSGYLAASNNIVKMSEKGQLVVPLAVREAAELYPGQRFIAQKVEEGVLFKVMDMPNRKKEFEELSKKGQTHVIKYGLTNKDVEDAVAWAKRH